MKGSLVCNVLVVICTFCVSVHGFGRVGAPGPQGPPGGSYQPFGALGSGGRQGRLISPGSRVAAPGSSNGEIGEQGTKEEESPQIRPDIYSVADIEQGVQSTIGRIRGCPGQDDSKIVRTDIGKFSGKMCLELLCASPCQYGHVMRNGCPTCKCIKLTGESTSPCPRAPIEAMWYISSTNMIGIASETGIYTMKENGVAGPSSVLLRDHLEQGGLCGPTIDAAITLTLDLDIGRGEYTVFFSGTQYSIYKDTFTHVSGPHSIHHKYENGRKAPLQLTFPWYVEKIDAAMAWGKSVYFFFKYFDTGYYSKFDSVKNEMYIEYPKRTVNWWKGLPKEGPDSAYRSTASRKTYFTYGDLVYEMGPRARVNQGFPKPLKGNFVRC